MNCFDRYPRKQVVLDLSAEKPLTEQAHIEDCDMHRIMGQFEKTGLVSHLAKYKGQYGNMVDAPTFQQAMDAVATAKQMFDTVPGKIRAKFGNDPATFLAFVQDNNNYDEIKEMGLDVSHLTPPQAPIKTAAADPSGGERSSPGEPATTA